MTKCSIAHIKTKPHYKQLVYLIVTTQIMIIIRPENVHNECFRCTVSPVDASLRVIAGQPYGLF